MRWALSLVTWYFSIFYTSMLIRSQKVVEERISTELSQSSSSGHDWAVEEEESLQAEVDL